MKYRTILADPPWPQRYPPRNSLGSHETRSIIKGCEKPPYPTMSTEQIAALAVRDLAHRDGVNVFLWTTTSMLKTALSILDEWRTPFRQMLVWQKTNPSPFAGRGSFLPLDLEYLLIGRAGHAKFLGRASSSVFVSAGTGGRISDGSRKPDAIVDLIEELSPGPYLELFARRARFGWDYWGDESLGTAALETGAKGPLALERTE